GLSELPDPGSRCVFREIRVEGLLRGIDDVGRRREVRLPDREGQDLLAACLHLRDEVSDVDGRRGLNRADTLREIDHADEEHGRLESFTARHVRPTVGGRQLPYAHRGPIGAARIDAPEEEREVDGWTGTM